MTMTYKVREKQQYAGLTPGDMISATLVVVDNEAYLKDVAKTGTAPLDKPQSSTSPPAPSASSGFELLKLGEPAPNVRFLDQDGRARELASFKGTPVILTFIYTHCPLPNFCPLMDRNFVALQKSLKETAGPKVHLLSVSFDPTTDTPPVLKKHATDLGADPAIWTFATGDRDDIDQFAMRFGVTVVREMNDPRDITHTLRTALLDSTGRLAKTYVGNEWKPEQVLEDLRALPAGN
jgi:protein SCO1/2